MSHIETLEATLAEKHIGFKKTRSLDNSQTLFHMVVNHKQAIVCVKDAVDIEPVMYFYEKGWVISSGSVNKFLT